MSPSREYRGMRWLKCDLHVHTPEDARHWTDSDLRLSSPRNERDLQDKARCFLHRCHQLGLQSIGIVDHNFSTESNPRMWFLTHLIEQNESVSGSLGRLPLVIFPGFEIDIRYHILCLFNPVRKGKNLQQLSDILTNMGLVTNCRFLTGVLQQPKHHGQCWSLREVLDKVQNEEGGIVLAAHAFSNDGICNDTANIRDFLENPDLNAVEINVWPAAGKAQGILDGSNISWKRAERFRQPAPICGSDCKSLVDPACENNLGCRFTWIKMSEPSIEALRQAFLDPESRICLDPEPRRVSHTHIQSLKVMGTKFLQDQAVLLSPHLNCLIGGRGSGKSMVFESLRLALRGDMPFRDVSEDHVAAWQVRRLQGTFQDNTRIEVTLSHDDMQDVFVVEDSAMPARIENREVNDAPTVFRRLSALIFSQEEITQVADRQKSLLDFIDSLVPERLERHRSKSREIVEQLKSAHQIEETLKRLNGELLVIKQETEELGRQLTARAQVQEELKSHRSAQEGKRFIEDLQGMAKKTGQRLTALAEELQTEQSAPKSLRDSFPHSDFFGRAQEDVAKAYQKLGQTIKTAIEELLASVREATSKHPDWQKVNEAIDRAEKEFHRACESKGLTPEEAEELRETERQHRLKQAALLAKQDERDQAAKQKPDTKKLLEGLTDSWHAETQARFDILDEITQSETMPRTEAGNAIARTSLVFAGDREGFLKLWGELAPDRRSAAGRAWDRYARDGGANNIGDELFDAFQLSIGKQQLPVKLGNPFQWLEANWGNDEGLPPIVLQHRVDIDRVRGEKADKWFDLILTRIRDAADLNLLRGDGTEAGSFGKGDLSTGQKNTAILSLLLARGSGPVLIDQPEDELDNEFLYRELVPMFRKVKRQRQLIIVTHNANIPVNADAELVYALKAEGGRGRCRTQGGLDRLEVTRAVLDIMEGSEEAFRRRKEKYHF